MASIVDTNVYLSRWPFRRVPGDEPQQLVDKLRRAGVTQAWAASFDALLHRDIGALNARTADDCKRFGNGLLTPVGAINPMLPDWREDLRRCDAIRIRAIRLHPNYHGYTLDQPVFAEVLASAAEGRVIVQLAVQMEDERTQHPLVRVPPVALEQLPAIVKALPRLKLQLLNHARLAAPLLTQLVAAGNVAFDFAMVESVHGLSNLLTAVGPGRVMFGSYYPFFIWESAYGKVKESGTEHTEAIFHKNAQTILEVK